MRRYIILSLSLCLALWAGFAAAQTADKEKAAVAAAEQWLSLVDSGNYQQSWKEAAELFRKAVPERQWLQSLEAVRAPLGKLKSRKVKSSIYTTSLPGAPDGEYVVIQFDTSFDNKGSSIETVTPMFEKEGTWRVSGYFVK